MRRSYGSMLPDIIDQPIGPATMIDIYQATAEALDLWEPRYRLTRVEISAAAAGSVGLVLHGDVAHQVISVEVSV